MASAVRVAYEVQGGWPQGCLWLLLQPRSWKLIMIFSSLQQLGISWPPPGWETILAWGSKKRIFKFKANILGIKKTKKHIHFPCAGAVFWPFYAIFKSCGL